MYFLLYNIGICSFYFHATLSELGGYFDIISISFLLLVGKWRLDSTYKTIFLIRDLCIHLIIAKLSHPLHIGLLFYIGYQISVIYSRYNKIYNYSPHKITERLFILAVLFWITDRVCYQYVHFHWIFHILVGYVGYDAIHFLHYIDKYTLHKI